MSDGEVEVEAPQGYPVLPKDVTNEIGSIKLFNKWSYEDVEIRDISLTYVYYPPCDEKSDGLGGFGLKRLEIIKDQKGNANQMLHDTATTSKYANQSTSHTLQAAMQ